MYARGPEDPAFERVVHDGPRWSGGRGRIRTFCHSVIGRGPRHSDSLPLLVLPAGAELAAVGAPAPIRTEECLRVKQVPWTAWRREREFVSDRDLSNLGRKRAALQVASTRVGEPARSNPEPDFEFN